jgi:hypothetical protein
MHLSGAGIRETACDGSLSSPSERAALSIIENRSTTERLSHAISLSLRIWHIQLSRLTILPSSLSKPCHLRTHVATRLFSYIFPRDRSPGQIHHHPRHPPEPSPGHRDVSVIPMPFSVVSPLQLARPARICLNEECTIHKSLVPTVLACSFLER